MEITAKGAKRFLYSLFGLNHNYMTLSITALLSIILSLQIDVFVEKFIWAPAYSLLVLSGIMVFDLFLAIRVSRKRKGESLQTTKLMDFGMKFITVMCAVTALNWCRKLDADMPLMEGVNSFSIIANFSFWYLIGTQLLSAFRHGADLKELPFGLSEIIKNKIDSHKSVITNQLNKIHDEQIHEKGEFPESK